MQAKSWGFDPIKRLLVRVASGLNALLGAGTQGYPAETIQRLRIVNCAAYLIIAVTLNYIILYASFDAEKYWLIIIANVFLAFVAFCVPFLHRFHDHAGVALIVVSEYLMLFYLISQVGREAGIQSNYIVGAAAPFLVVDRSRKWLILSIVGAGFVLNVAAWFFFPAENAAIVASDLLLANIYVNSVLGTVGIIAFIVYYAFNQVTLAKAETDALLRNILPDSIADRLKARPDETIADSCPEASVLFADLVGFTPTARRLGASKIVDLLNEVFTRFDRIGDELQVEKIKTIGDAYMVVAGLPEPQEDHALLLARMALRMLREIDVIAEEWELDIGIRIGIETGPVMAGVIGKRKFSYDVWGDTVNMASRLESHGVRGKIQVSEEMHKKLDGMFVLEPRGEIEIKGVGAKETWFLTGMQEISE